jgi:hypothetical protein
MGKVDLRAYGQKAIYLPLSYNREKQSQYSINDMNKALLKTLVLLITFAAGVSRTWAQNPVITNPADGAIVSTSGFPVTVTPNPVSSFTLVTVFELNGTTRTRYIQSPRYNGTAPFTYNVPSYNGVTYLKANTSYQVEVISYTSTYATSNSRITVTTNNVPPPVLTPVITDPVDGAIVSTSGFPVTVTPSPQANFTIVNIFDTSTGTIYEQSPRSYGTAPFTYNVPLGLTPNTQYRVEAISYTPTLANYKSQLTVTTSNVSASPLVISPVAPNLTGLNPCGFTVSVADFGNATAMRLQWRRTSGTAESFNTSTRAIVRTAAPYNLTLPVTALQPNETYQFRVVAGNMQGPSFIALGLNQTLFSAQTGNIPNANPIITSPTNGAQGISLTTTVTVAPYAGTCGTLTNPVTIEIDPDGDFVAGSPGYQVSIAAVQANGTYQAAFAQLLQGTTYRVRATFPVLLNGKTTSYQNAGEHTFTTATLPVVTVPASGSNNVSTCGTDVIIAPYSGAASMEVRFTPGNVPNETSVNWGSVAALTAVRNADNGTFSVFIPQNGVLAPNTTYTIRVRAISNQGNQIPGAIAYSVFTTGQALSYTPVFAGPENAPAPDEDVVIVPVDGSTNVSLTPTFKVNAFEGCSRIFLGGRIEIDRVGPVGATGDAAFSGPNYQVVNVNNAGPYVVEFSNTLLPNSVYQVRFTFLTNPAQPGNQTTIRITTGSFLPATRVISYRDGAVEKPFISGAFRNSFTQTFTAQLVPGATSYDWQFDDDPGFGSPVVFNGQSNTLTFNATDNGFVSGALYYVRVRGRAGASPNIYPAPGSQFIVNYYHPLFAPVITEQTTLNMTRRRFGVSSTAVSNATHYFFQIALANPANNNNPAADFVEGNYFQNDPNFTQSALPSFTLAAQETVEATANPGNMLYLANNFKQWPGGLQVSFGTIQAQPQTTYRLRVVAAREVNGQFVQHTEMGAVPVVTFGTNGIPDRAHPIVNIVNGATDVSNRYNLQYTQVKIKGLRLFWDITQYQVQVSETPFVDNSDNQTLNGLIYSQGEGGVTEGDPVLLIPGLKFLTTYYVRARSLATVNGVPNVPSPWTEAVAGGIQEGISFTTRRVPTPAGIALNNITANRKAQVSVSQVRLADRYEWVLEQTSGTPQTFPTKVTTWVNATFGEYLAQGQSYKLTVRAFSSVQAPNASAYSLPVSVNFTVSPTAARQSADVAAAGTAPSETSVLFPNPFRQQTQLQLRAGYEKVRVSVVSAKGQVMLSQEAMGGQTVPLGQHWPAGVYVVQVLDANGLRETFRLVKQ